MKKIISISLVLAMVMAISSWAAGEQEKPAAAGTTNALKVGLVLSTGGLGDKNFNDMAYAGVQQAQEKYGISFDYMEPKSVSDFLPMLRSFAETGEYDLVIAMGNDQLESVKEIAKEFPNQKVSFIDSAATIPGVRSVATKWSEQTFLCGVVAGLATRSTMPGANAENVVGVVLGMDFPNLREGVAGFISGVKYVNPDAEILQATIGSFNDPGKGKEIALSMYNRGADFVQHIAGASGLGVFNAAKTAGRYAFGVGGNQNWLEPDVIVATSIRNVNDMVLNEVTSVVDKTWVPGLQVSGMKEGAVGYSTDQSNAKLPEDIRTVVEKIRTRIISGELVPNGDLTQMANWVAANQYK
ncbi:MAG: BMP family ABC transporter substrate-binding protein [Spirochaetota bacterium]